MKNNKKLRLLQKSLFAVCIMLISISMAYASTDKISARSAYIMDSGSGKVLYAKNPDLRQCPASTTKLVTAMTALDRLDLDQVVEISYHAANIYPSHKRIRKGD
ncbi:MAG: D-alanyl-D-alanine carboxypeptidase, partial [Nitrospirae bacterium]|nr:D-alanyl-D-alanine carboxypeptidase [Nitrospirota bacterium]